uniref:5-formyltetrahydrofolate cyclo-ligase n=2 Tax=Cacopsylla melanoneura TaxID=428564 RepID=A0A8D8R5Q8_9HEMI
MLFASFCISIKVPCTNFVSFYFLLLPVFVGLNAEEVTTEFNRSQWRTTYTYRPIDREIIKSRPELIKYLDGKVKNLSAIQKEEQSELVFRRVLSHPYYKKSKRIGIYVAKFDEIGTKKIIEFACSQGKECFIPWYEGDVMQMYRVYGLKDIHYFTRENEDKVLQHYEPWRYEDAMKTGGLDLVILPGSGFTVKGKRIANDLGRYREYIFQLKQINPNCKTFGLAFKCQLVKDPIPMAAHDIGVDAVIHPYYIYNPTLSERFYKRGFYDSVDRNSILRHILLNRNKSPYADRTRSEYFAHNRTVLRYRGQTTERYIRPPYIGDRYNRRYNKSYGYMRPPRYSHQYRPHLGDPKRSGYADRNGSKLQSSGDYDRSKHFGVTIRLQEYGDHNRSQDYGDHNKSQPQLSGDHNRS